MPTDHFPNFTSQYITTSLGAHLFVRTSAPKSPTSKPPLLLLHGFPQTHLEFHRITPSLLPHFTLILLDLRGYGASSPVPSTNGSGYTKRLMGQDCLSVMEQLGYSRDEKFAVLGHDRGARVAYRLAFDNPERLSKVIVVDIVPTASMFRSFGDVTAGLKGYHWLFLSQPEPFPERLIGGVEGGKLFLEHSLASWAGTGTLDAYDAEVMRGYREAYCAEEKIHATCEDYRAGAHFDRVYDEEELERGRKIQVPVLAVWGEAGLFASAMKAKKEGPLEVWQKYCVDVRGRGLGCGHFIPEEEPEGLVEEALKFLL